MTPIQKQAISEAAKCAESAGKKGRRAARSSSSDKILNLIGEMIEDIKKSKEWANLVHMDLCDDRHPELKAGPDGEPT